MAGVPEFLPVLLLAVATVVLASDVSPRGPSFLLEPPSRLEFSNSSGGWLDCTASGSPLPSIAWVTGDGARASDLGSVRRMLPNGTLVLLPFHAAAYRQDVHSATYRCIASNSVGSITSREVLVRAVVTQAYSVEASSEEAPRGCTALLRCNAPSFVRDLVRVVSWMYESNYFIYPSLEGDGKHHMLPSGELLVHNVEYADQFTRYWCRTRHRLTNQVVTSSPTVVRVTDHSGSMPPTMVLQTGNVQAAQDEGARLLCLAQGCPEPTYSWELTGGGGSLGGLGGGVEVFSGPRVKLLGPLLVIESAAPEDSGAYRCTAHNSAGEASAELHLSVFAPLQVVVEPEELTVQLGGSAEFRCRVAGGGVGPEGLITWYKDGAPLPGSPGLGSGLGGPGMGSHGAGVLILDAVSREDRGMYQCVVRRAEGDTVQAAAELRLGDAPPVLQYSFIEQTLQPGPSVSLKCSAAGQPTPIIEWRLDGFPLPNNHRFLIGQYVTVHGDVISHVNISNVMVEDGGEYRCNAKNRAGQAHHAARLNVYGPPYIRNIPTVKAVAGETLGMKCPVAGYPIEQIKWERGGAELPQQDLRQKVLPGGVLEVERVEREKDAGTYTCTARNKQGQTARRSAEVMVIVPPVIEAFAFQDGLSEGMRTRTVCGVSHGDPPLSIRWLKDGEPLSPDLGANVSHLDQYSSLLSFPHLSAAHSGDFTCVASNTAAEVRYTAHLRVKVPPSWEVEPQDVSVDRGRHAALHCRAKGVPHPTTIWKKALGDRTGEYQEIRERHPSVRLPGNGTLVLQGVSEDAEGFYLCQANNSIGSPLGKVVQLKVKSRPYFTSNSRIVSVKKGETAELQCDVNGDLPISVVWLRSGMELTPATNYRVSVKVDPKSDGVLAEMQLASTESGDTGGYYCQARNQFGADKQLVQLQVQEPPPRPTGLQTALVSSRSINLQWQTLAEDAEVTRFIVEYRQQSAGPGPGAPSPSPQSWQQLEVRGPHASAAIISDLRPATRYLVRVVAEGLAGRSEPSAELAVRTEPQQPAGPPLRVAARAVSSTALLVTWAPPLADLRHGDITSYNVGCREANVQGPYNFTSVPGDAEDDGEITLVGLSRFTRYTIVVQAVNVVGPGPMSEPISAVTLEDVPSAPPEDVRCVALSSQSLQVSWHQPPANQINGVLQGYQLHYQSVVPDPRRHDAANSTTTTALLAVLLDLRKATNYSITVGAFTRKGAGVTSRASFCATEEDAPGPPAEIKVVVSTPQSLLLTWLPPAEPNGIITKYNVYSRVADGRGREADLKQDKQVVGASQTSLEVKGLEQNVEYQFWVTAATRVGEGQSSHYVSQVPTARVPARVASIGGVVARPWRGSVALACRAVGQPHPRAVWTRSLAPHPRSHRGQVLDSGELAISGLLKEDAGNYTCFVENKHGSDSVSYSLVVQVPPGVPQLFVGSSTSSSILVHWKAGDSGGSAITGFTLHYRRLHGQHGDTSLLDLPRSSRSHDIKFLQCGTTYHLQLVAHNGVGSSAGSPALSVRTQGQAPGKPAGPALLSPSSSGVLIKLAVWPDNGCPLLYFVVRYRLLNAMQWTLVSNSLKPQRRFIISGLSSTTGYQLQIEAHNIAGSSMEEYTFFTLTEDGAPPPPELVQRGGVSQPFYMDFRIMLALAGALVAVAAACVVGVLCWRTKQTRPLKETMENKQNTDAAQRERERERYYATMRKMALQSGEKIPETSEDISPYATFQLSERSGSIGPLNTLLHSFMYHEQAMTDGCASPPPPNSKAHKERQRRRSSHKTRADSEESDSDGDPLTSSRTESSNQLDTGPMRGTKQSFIYHGAQSSTSSDISPMSEQKSLPRRGRHSKWLVPVKPTLRTMFPGSGGPGGPAVPLAHRPPARLAAPLPLPSTSGGRRRSGAAELSEAECDIDVDTLKKLKLSLRPATPGVPGQSSDYSIAV